MAVTNTEEEVVADNDATVTETDLHKLKYPDGEVETADEAEDETSESEEVEVEEAEDAGEEVVNDDQAQEDEPQGEAPTFIKGFAHIKGDTPEEYAKNLEEAYRNSTTEALRLKKLAEAPAVTSPIGDDEDDDSFSPKPAGTNDPTQLWVSQQMDKEINRAYDKFKTDYPQVDDPELYDKFTEEVSIFSQSVLAKGQMPDPEDLYRKAAVSLGWEKASTPNDKEKLGAALKTNAATTPARTSGAKPPARSKVTDAQVAIYRKTARNGHQLSDADIRKELEAYVT